MLERFSLCLRGKSHREVRRKEKRSAQKGKNATMFLYNSVPTTEVYS